MTILTLQHIAKSFGTDEVLRDVSLSLNQGERLGLVGVNGSGKTTLLRVISGELAPDGGQMSVARGTRVAMLSQVFHPAEGSTVMDEARRALDEIHRMEARLRELERRMGDPADDEVQGRLLEEYARVTERFERAGGYGAESQVTGVLAGLGFSEVQFAQPAHTLSGGELTRLGLAKLLLQKPDLLLLDEPTNHLDMGMLGWLEGFLLSYPGSIITVSHDRYFLDAVCTGVAEILFGALETYPGNYTAYAGLRAQRHAARNKAYALQQKEIQRQRAIIARFRSFNREKSIRAAESREKALARMELVDRPQEEKQTAFRFRAARSIHGIALEAEGLSKAFGDRVLFQDVDIILRGDDRAALIGPNGVGKTTLVRCLTGRETPDAGTVAYSPKADVGYYDQRQLDLSPDKDVLNEVWDAFPLMGQSQIRGALGLFLFSGDDVFTPVGLLSGGEKSRVSLAKLMLRQDNVLLLDEPTNHLDADSREALEEALAGFEGTILAVSHDRYFINRFANRLLVMDEGGIMPFEGNYDDYQRELARLRDGEAEEGEQRTRTSLARERKASRLLLEEQKRLQAAAALSEERVHQAEEELAYAISRQGEPEVYENPAEAAAQAARVRELRALTERRYKAWEEADRALSSFLRENNLSASED